MPRPLSPILRIVAAVVTIALAQSAFWSPGASTGLAVLLVSLFALSWWRPVWGLLALAALAPFGRLIVTGALEGFPIRGTESIALAWLAGVCLGWRRRDSAPLPGAWVRTPWLLFGAAAAASAAVLHRVSQAHHDWPREFLRRLGNFVLFGFQDLPGDPRPWMEPVSFGYLSTTAATLEGVAIVLLTAGFCRADGRLAHRLLAVSVASATVAGALSVWSVLEAAQASAQGLAALPTLLLEGRWAVHVNKVNTAGSYFVLMAVPAVALAAGDTRRRWLWVAAAAATGAGLLLTASLAAILGGAAVGSAVLGWRAYRTSDGRPAVRAAFVAVLILLVTLVALRVGTRASADRSLALRWAVTFVSLETAAEAPVFGVGIGTYPIRSVPHITPFVREGYGDGSMQPHNYLLQIATELGAVGVLIFGWALAGIVRGAMAGPDDRPRWDRVAACGLAAFLISALAGQPMIVDTVALPAFLLMGIAAHAPGLPGRVGSSRWLVAGVAALAVTVPVRAELEVKLIDPRRSGYGTTFDEDPETDRRLVHFLGDRSRLFADSRAPYIRVEGRAVSASGPNQVFLHLSGPGIRLAPFGLRPDGVLTACVAVAPDAVGSSGRRPIDARVTGADGTPAPPGSAWAYVTGSDLPCR